MLKICFFFFISPMHLAQDFCALSISAFAFQAFFDLLNPLCIFLTFIERFTRTIMIPFAFSSFFLFFFQEISLKAFIIIQTMTVRFFIYSTLKSSEFLLFALRAAAAARRIQRRAGRGDKKK